ncbi:hypothetical protein GC088_10050 [Arthrobacter sp. JZ12]|uniref:hypothetical protein n=1 Tax=Arthrobacter sp. JZ12 TaxID=2654190 RepID=UPI002B4944F2|nr:hypothetical protein [Arthrobacter sp. JZ12]WRH25369.1 hypothetical protein GC088_10050 [Arthrobacter sp. JZ12]
MTIRKKTAYIGDVGEVEVLRALLDTGSAVNLITGADYGWDIHVQVPRTPTSPSDYRGEAAWGMSGRSAHIQVKSKTGNLSPSVDPGTVRGWITGSKTGAPTFVVLVVPGKKLYFSPKDLQLLLTRWEEKNEKKRADGKKEVESLTLPLSSARLFASEQLSWLLHLWSKYPGIMMSSTLEDWPSLTRQALSFEISNFIHQVVLAWLKSHFSDIYVGPNAKGVLKRTTGSHADNDADADFIELIQGADALGIAEAGYLAMHPGEAISQEDLEAFAWSVLERIANAIEKFDYRWPKAEFSTSYSSSSDIGRSREEAIDLVRDVGKFYAQCEGWLSNS